MIFYIFTIIIILLFIFTIYSVCIHHIPKKLNNINVKQEKEIFTDNNVVYITGLADILGGSRVTLKIKKHEIYLQKGMDTIKWINKDNLISAEIMNEHDIKKQVTLGRFLVFGVFSLFMQQNKTIYTNYLVLTYKQDNEYKKLVLHSMHSLEQIIKIFKEYIKVTS